MLGKFRFYLGTYTQQLVHVDGCGPGIVACDVELDTGRISIVGDPVGVPNPSYLWLNAAGDRLYAICEICDFEGRADGAVCVLGVDSEGRLALLQQTSSCGRGPAYCRGDEAERVLLLANYVEGNVVCFPLDINGGLLAASSNLYHIGCGPDALRQEGPHPHSILALPGSEVVLAADLGCDRIFAYRLDSVSKRIEKMGTDLVTVPAGSGPRHMALHPDGRVLYVALELSAEIARIRFDDKWKPLGEPDIVCSHGAGAQASSQPSEILVSADGRHLYIANRGLDCISAFDIEGARVPVWIGDYACGGQIPRHMALAPGGDLLLVANQGSNALVSLFRDTASGALRLSGESVEVGTPSFVEFVM